MEFLHFDHAVMPTLVNNAASEFFLVQMQLVQFAEKRLSNMIRFMFDNEEHVTQITYSESE